jgi:hypothetical protein
LTGKILLKFKDFFMVKKITNLLKPNVGFRDFIIGFLLGICIMLAVAAASNNDKSPGAYQCCAAGNESTAVFIIDTKTGHTWRLNRSDHYDYGTPQERKSIRNSIAPRVN